MSDKSYESVPGPSSFATFEAVRMQMRAFVSDRAWEPFHTPTNVLLGKRVVLCINIEINQIMTLVYYYFGFSLYSSFW